MSESEKPPINKTRLWFAVGYLILSAVFLVLCLASVRARVFYLHPKPDSFNAWRFLWCVAFSFVGFTALSFRLWRHDKSPYPLHVFYYPPLLLIISSLVFSACHVSEATSGFVFYYLSSALCFVFAFLVDSFWKFARSIVNKVSS
jgi:hypothetical protein